MNAEKKPLRKTKGCGVATIVDPKDLKAMAVSGMSPAQIASYYNLTRQGMVRLINHNAELKAAFKDGLNHVMVKCVRVLMDKLEKGDTFAAIYLLNNRCGWIEAKYQREKEVTDMPRVQVYLPDNQRDSVKNETIIEAE